MTFSRKLREVFYRKETTFEQEIDFAEASHISPRFVTFSRTCRYITSLEILHFKIMGTCEDSLEQIPDTLGGRPGRRKCVA